MTPAAAIHCRATGRGRRGFTLIELLVVIGLLVALTAVAIPALYGRIAPVEFEEAGRRAVAGSAIAAADAARLERMTLLELRRDDRGVISLLAVQLPGGPEAAARELQALQEARLGGNDGSIGALDADGGFDGAGLLGARLGRLDTDAVSSLEGDQAEFGFVAQDRSRRERRIVSWPRGTRLMLMTAEIRRAREAALEEAIAVDELEAGSADGFGRPSPSPFNPRGESRPGGRNAGSRGVGERSSVDEALLTELEDLLGLGETGRIAGGFSATDRGATPGGTPRVAAPELDPFDSAAVGIGGIDSADTLTLGVLLRDGSAIPLRTVLLAPAEASAADDVVALSLDAWAGSLAVRPLVDLGVGLPADGSGEADETSGPDGATGGRALQDPGLPRGSRPSTPFPSSQPATDPAGASPAETPPVTPRGAR